LETNKIKNIIFDLGGVIININLNKTTQAFADLTGRSFQEIQDGINRLKVYYKYEVGELNDTQFRNLIRECINTDLPDDKIDLAWNALLEDIPQERVRLIEKLRHKYRIFILSNTNHIHYQEVENILQRDAGVSSFSNIFEKVYLSWEMKLCKPFREIYEFVLKDAELSPSETLFIDDNLHNIEAASQLGIKGIHLQPPSTILDIFNDERFSKE